MNNKLKSVVWGVLIVLGSLFNAFVGNFFAAVMGRTELLNINIWIPVIVGVLWWVNATFVEGKYYQRTKSKVWELNLFFMSVLCYIVIGDISYIHIVPLTLIPVCFCLFTSNMKVTLKR